MVPADAIARLIHDAFADYHARFAEITRRAKTRFETQDWAAARADAVERIRAAIACILSIPSSAFFAQGLRLERVSKPIIEYHLLSDIC